MTVTIFTCSHCRLENRIDTSCVQVSVELEVNYFYAECLGCGLPTRREVATEIAAALLSEGAIPITIDPPITEEDIENLIKLLETDGWFEKLRKMTPGMTP